MNTFKKVQVKVKKNSGFDESFHSALTQKVGTLVPLFIDDVVPTQKTKISMAMNLKLPPMAFDTLMRVDYKVEAFFVSKRLLCGSYTSFFNDKEVRVAGASGFSSIKGLEPCLSFLPINHPTYTEAARTAMRSFVNQNILNPGTLCDYLGLNVTSGFFEQYDTTVQPESRVLNIMPLLAYHKICDDFYRNSQISQPYFVKRSPNAGAQANQWLACAPDQFYDSTNYVQPAYSNTGAATSRMQLADGTSIFALRQRSWGYDPYTTCLPTATQANPMKIEITTGAQGSYFTIPSLRAANSLQLLMDRDNLVGNVFVDNLHARYGANLSDGLAQRAMCLGSASYPIFTSGVLQNSNAQATAGVNNPFVTVGAQYGRAYANGSNFDVEFTAQEPGFLMIIGSVVPQATYTYNLNQAFMRYIGEGSITDLPHSYLELAGPEAVRTWSIAGYYGPDRPDVFGYQDRFWSFKDRVNEVHGLFRAGASLDSAVVQRDLSGFNQTSINTAFLEIPTDCMDNVTAVSADLSEYGALVDLYFNFFKTLPISQYCVPSLVDPATEHGRSILVKRGGTNIR